MGCGTFLAWKYIVVFPTQFVNTDVFWSFVWVFGNYVIVLTKGFLFACSFTTELLAGEM